MPATFSFTRVFVRLVGLALTLLGVVIMATQNLALVPVYATVAVALMIGVWTLALLAARAGVHAGFVVLIVILGLAGVVVSLTGEWVLYVLAGVGSLAGSEDLALRIERCRLVRAAN